jgi:hypothetical protein
MMISQSSVTCAWPNLGVNVIFSNEGVNEARPFGPIFANAQSLLPWCATGAIITCP